MDEDKYILKRHGTFSTDIIIPLDENEVRVGDKGTPELIDSSSNSENCAKFLYTDFGGWCLQQFKSLSGVYKNGVKIGKKDLYLLNHGDVIGIGAASGDTEQDYVFKFCKEDDAFPRQVSVRVNNRVLNSAEKSKEDASYNASISVKNSCHIIDYAKNNVPIRASVHNDREHLSRNNKSTLHPNNVFNNVSAVKIKKRKAKGTCEAKTVNKSLTVKQKAPQSHIDGRLSSRAFVRTGQSLGVSSFRSSSVSNKNTLRLVKHNPVASNSDSDVFQGRKAHQSESCEVKPFPPLKELKVILTKLDMQIETSKVERHGTLEDDTESSCSSDVVLPPRQRGHRLRIDSSSDESENCADLKASSFSKERTKCSAVDFSHSISPALPIVKSCAPSNITAALNSAEASDQCYPQVDDIVISSDKEDYVKNLPSIKIETVPTEDVEFSNAEWQCVSNSQNTYKHSVKQKCLSNSETSGNLENALHHTTTVNGSASGTKLLPKICKHQTSGKCADGGEAVNNLHLVHNAEPHPSDNEDDLNASENIENIVKYLRRTVNNKLLPENSLNHSACTGDSSKNQEYELFPPLTQALLSDGESEMSDSLPHSDHPEVQRGEFQKCFSKNNKVPPFSENRATNHHTQIGKGGCQSARKSTEIIHDFSERQKEETLSKTVLTKTKPMQCFSQKQSGHEEWFTGQYQSDKTLENRAFSKKGKSQRYIEGNSEAQVHKTSNNISSLTSARKESGKGKKSKSKAMTKHKIKNNENSLCSQMQSMCLTIPQHPRSTPAVVSSNSEQTCDSIVQVENVSFGLKRKAPMVSEDHSVFPVKERKSVVKKVELLSSVPFLGDTPENVTNPQRDYVGHKVSTRNLTDKSHKKVTSGSTNSSKNSDTSTGNSSSSHISAFQVPTLSGSCTVKASSSATHPVLLATTLPELHVPETSLCASHLSTVQAPALFGSLALSTSSSSAHPAIAVTLPEFVPAASLSASHPSVVQAPALSKSHFPAASSAFHPSACQVPVQSLVPAPSSSALSVPTLSGSHVPPLGSSASHLSTCRAPALFQSFISPTPSSISCISDLMQQGRALTGQHSTSTHGTVKNTVAVCSTSVPQRFVQPHPVAKLTVQLNSDIVILKILSWMPAWLTEQQHMHVPPPIVEWKKIQKLKLFYESLDDYVMSFYNLLLIEMWESLYRARKGKKVHCDFTFAVTSYSESSDVLTIDCESLLSARVSHMIVEGTLLIIDLRMTKNPILELFGYVNQCKLVPYTGTENVNAELKFSSASEENAFLCKFKLQTKKKKSFRIYKNMKACVLSYISPSMQVVNSLLSLQSSPLIKDILCPQEKNCTIPSAVHVNISALGNFSKTQALAIIAISNEMRNVYSVPRILLLQGLPGTGKTHVIMGIIQNLLNEEHKKIKILVTAPSNAAADEIGRRLIALRKIQSQARVQQVCFVRVGIPKQIHPSVEPFSLDSLVHATFKKKWSCEIEYNRTALCETQVKINSLKQVTESMKFCNLPQKDIESKLQEMYMHQRRAKGYEDEISDIRNKTVKNSDPSVYETKLHILKNADVILSTLGSCRQSVLKNAFGKKSDVRFTCCIVDEASQCTEPQVLQPLTYGMSKLLLVGDHKQLPATVLSRTAVDHGLEMSLFERIHLHFKKTLGRSPVHLLTEQYRMHSEICSFPSLHFYAQQLRTPPEINVKYDSFPLKPYLFLNIAYCKESNLGTSKNNDLEAEIIIQLCRELVNICPSDCSFGVITSYQGQKKIFEAAFSKHISCQNIEVNTVDGFQGREKDVILISCVPARSQDPSMCFLSSRKRFNVAVTRAAKCLIICGRTASLKENRDWNALITDAIQRNLLSCVTSVDEVPFLIRRIRKN